MGDVSSWASLIWLRPAASVTWKQHSCRRNASTMQTIHFAQSDLQSKLLRQHRHVVDQSQRMHMMCLSVACLRQSVCYSCQKQEVSASRSEMARLLMLPSTASDKIDDLSHAAGSRGSNQG